MEEKKKIKVSLKTAIIILIVLIAIIVISIILLNKYAIDKKSSSNLSNMQDDFSSNVEKYGKWINMVRSRIDFEWNGGSYNELNLESRLFKSYNELKNYFTNLETKINKKIKFDYSDNSVYKDFEDFDFNNNSLVLWVNNNNTKDFMYVEDVYIDNNKNLTVLIKQIIDSNSDFNKDNKNADVHLDFIRLYGNKGKTVKFEYEKMNEMDWILSAPSDDKPIIYLYPTENTEVSVKLLKKENLTCSYPKYKDEWKVLAKSDGNLTDLVTNRQLYSLYYESKNDIIFNIEKDGFVVKDEDVIAFLEEKLAILGLTEIEAEEFIVYWLPKLEANKYNYIRFATNEEINKNMPLEINPNPDTIIRVLMTFKGLEKPIDVQEQQLETLDRTGFVVVEWGGTEIK